MNKNPFQGDDEDPFSGARDEETGEIKREAPSTSVSKAEEPKKQSFGQAFAAARKAGDKTFMFGGKKYTTEMKGEAKKPAAPKAEPAKAEADKPRSRVSQVKGSMAEKMRALGINRYKSGGSVSASKRADGCAVKGKTKGRMV